MMTPKKRLFAAEYARSLNATKAAMAAGYSKRTAYSQGHRLLKDVEVEAEVQRLAQAKLEAVGIDAEWLLRRLVDLDEADIRDLFAGGWRIREIEQMPDAARRLIASLEITERREGRQPVRVTKIRFVDRLRVLEDIGKHVQIAAFRERVEHHADEGMAQMLLEARRRLHEARSGNGATDGVKHAQSR